MPNSSIDFDCGICQSFKCECTLEFKQLSELTIRITSVKWDTLQYLTHDLQFFKTRFTCRALTRQLQPEYQLMAYHYSMQSQMMDSSVVKKQRITNIVASDHACSFVLWFAYVSSFTNHSCWVLSPFWIAWNYPSDS